MQVSVNVTRKWDLFARELENLMQTRGLRLSQLDDRIGIHREKVRRLQQSLVTPRSLPVLNVEEMDKIYDVFEVTLPEQLHLHAAILATAIERTLLARLPAEAAYEIADRLLPAIEEALTTMQYEMDASYLRHGATEETTESDESEVDLALDEALQAIDRGLFALHLSHDVDALQERIEQARNAHASFIAALQALDSAATTMKARMEWHVWYEEAQGGLTAANERLGALGK